MLKRMVIVLITSGLTAFAFFDRWPFWPVWIGLLLFFGAEQFRDYKTEKRNQIKKEFMDALRKMSALFASGHPLEDVFLPSAEYVETIWGTKSTIASGFREIMNRIGMNVSAEDAFLEFASETKDEDIVGFAGMVLYVRRGHGRLSETLSDCSRQLSENMKTTLDINNILAAKRYEFRIMRLLPIGIILGVRLTSFSFVEDMYRTNAGMICMAVCLGIYLFSIFLGNRISRVEV